MDGVGNPLCDVSSGSYRLERMSPRMVRLEAGVDNAYLLANPLGEPLAYLLEMAVPFCLHPLAARVVKERPRTNSLYRV